MTRMFAPLIAVLALTACTGVGQAAAGGAASPTEDTHVRILARQPADCATAGEQRGAGAIRSREALASVARGAGISQPDVAAVLDWPVDYSRGESVVLVRAGALPNPAWTMSVDQDPIVVADALVLSARIDRPPPGRIVVQMIASPCVFLRLAASDYRRIDARWIERR